MDRQEEFQWPQRSQTLAQLPAEKLPPKKKRLRLAEAAQSSGESSFESPSMPRSPSQESNISHTANVSASFKETASTEPPVWTTSGLSAQMLTVPTASYQHYLSHKEMRRSASEQAQPSPQQTEQGLEAKSKSFDYGSLSSQQPTMSWKERRKCLLVKHATLGEPELEETGSINPLTRADSPKPGPSCTSHPPLCTPEASSQRSVKAPGTALQLIHTQPALHFSEMFPLQHRSQQPFSPGSLSQLLPITTEVLTTQILHRSFLQSESTSHPVQIHPTQLRMVDQFGIPFHQIPAIVPLQLSTRNMSRPALYFPCPPRLTPDVHPLPTTEGRLTISTNSSALTEQSLVTISYRHSQPVIATCLAQLTPIVSLMVPVRLQAHMPIYARAMYTTLSQFLASTHSQDPITCTAMVIMSPIERSKLQRAYLKVPSTDIKNLLLPSLPTEIASGSVEDYGPLGAGGSKRMLSPAASLELSTEAQRHQKRVKEEGETEDSSEEGDDFKQDSRQDEEHKPTGGKLKEDKVEQIGMAKKTVKVEGQAQVQRKSIGEKEGEKSTEKTCTEQEQVRLEQVEGPSTTTYPSLNTSTSVNWCYLHYIKPNPTVLQEPSTSVYSTWSVSAHNPNLPGLSTKVALSLLCSKQKHSSETYTMATAPLPAPSKMKITQSSSNFQHGTEVKELSLCVYSV